MNIENKHVIVGFSTHIFTNFFMDMLIHNCQLSKEKICFLTIDNLDGSYSENIRDIQIDRFSNRSIAEIAEARTITFMSLHKNNSRQVFDLLSFSPSVAEKLYIHMTDDELDRWVTTKKTFGVLKVTPTNYMSNYCIESLKLIRNLIASESFRDDLLFVSGRNDFNIVNARDAFSSMPYKLLEQYEKLYSIDMPSYNGPEQKILLGPKGSSMGFKDLRMFFHILNDKGVLFDYKYVLFMLGYNLPVIIQSSLLMLYQVYMFWRKKRRLEISYINYSNNIAYNSALFSCRHFFLQPRGSMSTVREYIKMKRGVVYVKKHSQNAKELRENEGIQIAEYESVSELVSLLLDNTVDVEKNSRNMIEYFNNSYRLLKSIYT